MNRPLLRFVLLAGLLIAPAARSGPRDDLLRLVPDDVAFCLVVQDLRGHARAVEASPFAKAFLTSPLAAALAQGNELKQLADADAVLRRHLGLGLAGLRDELFGDAFVFAFRTNPLGKADDDQGLLLLRARDARTLSAVVGRLTRVQTESGDLRGVEERPHGGVTYQRRIERQRDTFLSLNGPILAFSASETLLKEAIDRGRGEASRSAVAEGLKRLGAADALAALWVNPRAFDAAMSGNAAAAPAEEKAAHQTLLRSWKALDGAALTLTVAADVRVALTLGGRAADLPPAWRRLAASVAASELWDRFPDDALFAAAGRVDAAALLDALGELLTPSARTKLHDGLERAVGAHAGRDFIKDMVPMLGPDWGVCVQAPRSSDPSWWPRGLAVLRVRGDGGEPSADVAALQALTFYASFATAAHNSNGGPPMSLRSETRDGVRVKYLSGDGVFPVGVRPAFALHDGFLIVGTSPESVRTFALAPRRSAPRETTPLLRLSFASLRRYLDERRTQLVKAVAAKEGIAEEEGGRRLAGLRALLDHVESVEVFASAKDGRTTLTLRLEPTRPLR